MLSDKLVERLTMLGAMLDTEQRINNKLAYPLARLLSAVTTAGMTPGTTCSRSGSRRWSVPPSC